MHRTWNFEARLQETLAEYPDLVATEGKGTLVLVGREVRVGTESVADLILY